MASDSRSDWISARDEYLEPLDRRFPNQPLPRADDAVARQDPAPRGRFAVRLPDRAGGHRHQSAQDRRRAPVRDHPRGGGRGLQARRRPGRVAAVEGHGGEAQARRQGRSARGTCWPSIAPSSSRTRSATAASSSRRNCGSPTRRSAPGGPTRPSRSAASWWSNTRAIPTWPTSSPASPQPGAGSSPPASPGAATASPAPGIRARGTRRRPRSRRGPRLPRPLPRPARGRRPARDQPADQAPDDGAGTTPGRRYRVFIEVYQHFDSEFRS